jgi:hypothetical protein
MSPSRNLLSRGTDGSNPASSSGGSVSLPHPLSQVENPVLSARECAAGLTTGSAETPMQLS